MVIRPAPTTAALLVLASFSAPRAEAQFTPFAGDASIEAAWREAAGGGGPVPMETFESYRGVPSPFSGPSDAISALSALRVVLAGTQPGTFPGIYSDAFFAHSGANQLANFGGGIEVFGDYEIRPEPGRAIRALGFWQCDPQGDQTLYCYDAEGALVGTIAGAINNGSGASFAGFVSTTPIHRVLVEGVLGDGYNHIDDLQIVTDGGPTCPVDFNRDGNTDPDDLSDYIAAYFGPEPDPRCDLNGDGNIDPDDLSDYIAAYFNGCP